MPAMKNRMESTIKGGAEVTRILAEVKALDQITEKPIPMINERKSTEKFWDVFKKENISSIRGFVL